MNNIALTTQGSKDWKAQLETRKIKMSQQYAQAQSRKYNNTTDPFGVTKECKQGSLRKEDIKDITNIEVFQPQTFKYVSVLLGEGSYGRVRKVEYQKERAAKIESEASTTGSSDELETPAKGPLSNALSSMDIMSAQMSGGIKSTVIQPKKDETRKVERFIKQETKDKQVMACKIQSKYKLIKSKQEQHLFNEVNLMNQLDHPFMLTLNGVAQDKRNVYMYLDFQPHGDLMGVINQFKQLPEPHAKFYAAQIVSCFEYMHGRNLIYRDLKPENVMVSNNGYIKLGDFGFIKKVKQWERTYTFCGTPEYIAPEIIQNKGYSHAVDWYSLGIFMYEMMYGRPPFMANDPYEIFKKVLSEPLRFPRSFDKNAKSLIKKLCQHDLSQRYGNLQGGVKDIKEHKFFRETNFEDLLGMRERAPHVPLTKIEREEKDYGQIQKREMQEVKELKENQDNSNYPPIKKERDPFKNWF